MKTLNTFFKTMTLALATMVSLGANAQNRGGYNMGHNNGYRIEYNNDYGRHGYDRGPQGYDHRHNGYDRGPQAYYHNRHDNYGPAYHHAGPRPNFGRDGYLVGWNNRVRFYNGRYGYLRGRDWYWYDTYFEPAYYFANPLTMFHAHRLSPEGRAIVGTVATVAAVAGIINAIAR